MTNQHLVSCAWRGGCRSRLAWTDHHDDLDPGRLTSHGWCLGEEDVWVCPSHPPTGPAPPSTRGVVATAGRAHRVGRLLPTAGADPAVASALG